MSRGRIAGLATLVIFACGLAVTVSGAPAAGHVGREVHVPATTRGKPAPTVPQGPVIEVRFKESSEVRGAGSGISASNGTVQSEVDRLRVVTGAVSVEPLVAGLAQTQTSELSDLATARTGSWTPDMASWYRFTLPSGADSQAALAALRGSSVVSTAAPAPEAVPPPATPDFTSLQLHLDPAPIGTDSEFALSSPLTRGAGIRIVDLEYYWTANHEDLQLPASSDLGGGVYTQDTTFGDEHGTAVFGIMAAEDNGFGVTGGVPDATMSGISPNEPGFGYNPAGALTYLAAKVKPGDVVLVEQQTEYDPGGLPHDDYVPLEWEQASFDAIKNLSNLGVVVVETGGNGGQNLDDAKFLGRFNRGVRDSGAIIVGAGSSSGHAPLFYTNYGSRMDLQGFGENVVTTGGHHDFLQESGPAEKTIRYTSNFDGTSSAGPVVVNAVAAVQSYRKAVGGTLWSGPQMASALRQTGTPQANPGAGLIGPLPDIAAVIEQFEARPPVVQAARVGNVITVSADDGDGSGVASIEYRLDGGTWVQYSGPVDVEGIFEFEYRATDNKSNVSQIGLIQVNKRPSTKPPPVTALNMKLKSAAKVKRGKMLKVAITVGNIGDTTITGLNLRGRVPKRLARKPAGLTVSSLSAGAVARRALKVAVKRSVRKIGKLKVKVSANAAGRTLVSHSRTVKIVVPRKKRR